MTNADLEAKVKKLEKTLSTLIAWQARDLGEHGVKQLLDMLSTENEVTAVGAARAVDGL